MRGGRSTGFGGMDFTGRAIARRASARKHLWAARNRHTFRATWAQLERGAFQNGVAVDMSFGASPQSGLPQNNRVGDIDVFAVLHMMKKLRTGPDDMAALLGSQSGPAGISDTSGDLRDLEEAAAKGEKRARLALGVFVRAIRHYVGAFMLELGGADVATFRAASAKTARGFARRGEAARAVWRNGRERKTD